MIPAPVEAGRSIKNAAGNEAIFKNSRTAQLPLEIDHKYD
jgi:hypothetical protein